MFACYGSATQYTKQVGILNTIDIIAIVIKLKPQSFNQPFTPYQINVKN